MNRGNKVKLSTETLKINYDHPETDTHSRGHKLRSR